MGQKINPLGFRLGTTQSHHSLWFEQPKNYPEGLQEDKKIQDCIKNYIEKKYKNLFQCRDNCIYKYSKNDQSDPCHNIYRVPKIVNREWIAKNQRITEPCTKKIDSVNKKLNITITKIAKPYGHPNILAEYIAKG